MGDEETWRPAAGQPARAFRYETPALESASHRLRHLHPSSKAVQMVFTRHCGCFCRALNDWLVKDGSTRDARPARLGRESRSEHREIGAPRSSAAQRIRASFMSYAVMVDMPLAARLLADLRRRQRLSAESSTPAAPITPPTSVCWVLSHQGLRRAAQGVPDPNDQSDRGGCVRASSEAEDGDAGIMLQLAVRPIFGGLHKIWRGCRWRRRGSDPRRGKFASANPLFRCSRRCWPRPES